MTELSKTLRDAISITRGLGYSYIWIDALCICQDSADDWRTISSHMVGLLCNLTSEMLTLEQGEIYMNSACTITASAAVDSTQGMFLDRDSSVTGRLVLRWHENPNIEIVVGNAEIDPSAKRVDAGPLYKRGWCYQETTLSHRVLHYTNGELVFHCDRIKVTESAWEFGFFRETAEPQPIDRWRYETLGVEMIYFDKWREVVNEYTRRMLTFEGDRLLAVSAIARTLFYPKIAIENPKDMYIAGMFKGNFHHSLGWGRDPSNPEPLKRSKTYVAPSWSWASVIGCVEFVTHAHTPIISLLDIGATPINKHDPFGQLSDGFMKVDGYMKRAINNGRSNSYQSFATVAEEEQAHISPLCFLAEDESDSEEILGQMSFDDADDEKEREIYCLLVRAVPVRGKDWNEDGPLSEQYFPEAKANFIALCEVQGRGSNYFRRVGIGEEISIGWFEHVERMVLTII